MQQLTTLQAQTVVQAKMMNVVRILEEHLDRSLPSIGSIAKEMAVSESTLKRNFKQVYGTSIYNFYLQRKMQQARQLLMEKNVSVKEVAYRVGYEKPSNFIRIFKKFYRFSPGTLRKKWETLPKLSKEAYAVPDLPNPLMP